MTVRLDRVTLIPGGVDAEGWTIGLSYVATALAVADLYEPRGWFVARRTGVLMEGREVVEIHLEDQDADLPDDHECWEEGCVPGRHFGRTAAGLCMTCGGCGQGECCGPCPDECFTPLGWERFRRATYRMKRP